MAHPMLEPTLSNEGRAKLLERLKRILSYQSFGTTIADLFIWLQRNIGLSEDDALAVVSIASDLNLPDQAVVRWHLVELYRSLGGDCDFILQ